MPTRRPPLSCALAIAIIANASACASNPAERVDAGQPDGGQPDAAQADASVDSGTPTADAGPSDGGAPDASTADAGMACQCDPGMICNVAMQCVFPPVPLGGFCGPSESCPLADPGFAACANAQCASGQCAPGTVQMVLPRDVCIQSCTVYQDDNGDGVNDPDAPLDDCNPIDIVQGPAGGAYHCVSHSSPMQAPLGYCVPGSVFSECDSNLDCPANEVCALGSVLGAFNLRCYAAYRENPSWSASVVRLGQSCNEDPAAGPLAYCADGLCLGDGNCSAYCTDDTHCDTTHFDPGQRCEAMFCTNEPSRGCTVDADCSSLHCAGTLDLGGGDVFSFCEARP